MGDPEVSRQESIATLIVPSDKKKVKRFFLQDVNTSNTHVGASLVGAFSYSPPIPTKFTCKFPFSFINRSIVDHSFKVMLSTRM